MFIKGVYQARKIGTDNPRMKRAGPLSDGTVLVALLIGLAPGVADLASATRGNTTAGAITGITAPADVRRGQPANNSVVDGLDPLFCEGGAKEGAEGDTVVVFPVLPHSLDLSLVGDSENNGAQ